MVLNFVYGGLLGVAHFVSDRLATHKQYQTEIRSLAAGVSLTYLLIYLLPELYGGVVEVERLLFLFVLLGATAFHLIEKYLYQHERKEKLIFEIRAAHTIFFFIYHFIIGIILVAINAVSYISGLLFFIPILFYTVASQVSLHQLHANITERMVVRLILSSSTLFGVVLATLFSVPTRIYFPLLAFIAGALLYNVMVDVIPKEKEGNILFFLFGTIAYTAVILTLGGF